MSTALSKKKIAILSVTTVALLIALLTLCLNRSAPLQLKLDQFDLLSRRGNTVQHLQAIRRALQTYRQTHGDLPQNLTELGLSTEILEDGAGRNFVYTNRYIQKGYAPGKGAVLVVGMRAPTGDFPFDPNKWSYAIVESTDGKLTIRSSSAPERLRP